MLRRQRERLFFRSQSFLGARQQRACQDNFPLFPGRARRSRAEQSLGGFTPAPWVLPFPAALAVVRALNAGRNDEHLGSVQLWPRIACGFQTFLVSSLLQTVCVDGPRGHSVHSGAKRAAFEGSQCNLTLAKVVRICQRVCLILQSFSAFRKLKKRVPACPYLCTKVGRENLSLQTCRWRRCCSFPWKAPKPMKSMHSWYPGQI